MEIHFFDLLSKGLGYYQIFQELLNNLRLLDCLVALQFVCSRESCCLLLGLLRLCRGVFE